MFRVAWFHKLAGNDHSMRLVDSAKTLAAETLEHAKPLSIVCDINLRVHTPYYNELLQRMLAVPTTAAAVPGAV